MATMTEDGNIKSATGTIVSYPVKAAEVIYKGQLVSVVDGYAQPLADGEKFAGVSIQQVDNSSGSAGDLSVEVDIAMKREVYLDNVNKYMTGAYVYAKDDNGETGHTLAPMGTPVGRVIQVDGFSTDYALIQYDTNLCRENMGGVLGYFNPLRVVPNMDGATGAGTGVAGPWIRTSVNGPENIVVISDAQGKAYYHGINITTDSAENDGESIQIMGEPFLLDKTTRPCFFGARIKLSEATQSDVLAGLAITDTTLLGGMTDGITWRKVDGSTDTKLYVEKDSTETVSASSEHTMTTSAVTLGFVYDGSYVYPYVNGVASTGLAVTNLPDNEGLTPSFEVLTGAAASINLSIYFFDAYMIV